MLQSQLTLTQGKVQLLSNSKDFKKGLSFYLPNLLNRY